MEQEIERCDKRHDHVGPWWLIGVALLLLFVGWYTVLFVNQQQFSVIYDRVGAIQRQLECPPTELLVADHEGTEYCFEIPTPAR